MISRFINLFKKSDGDEQRAFQRRVLSILRDISPGSNYTTPDDALSIELDGQVFGLTNIRANFLLSSQTDDDLRSLVSDHFQKVFTGFNLDERAELTWEQAKEILMPQLMPIEFIQKLELVHSPFGDVVVQGYVLDGEKTYSYVSKTDIERWNVDEFDLREPALANLDKRTKGIEVTEVPGPNTMVIVNPRDSFDAVRIISPRLSKYVGGILGTPFYFGVPNRDFLICWVQNGDVKFQNEVRSTIAKDFEERPYPLSPAVFEAGEDGEITQVRPENIDPRAAFADRN
ncbi:hypothetical protein BH10ACI2_BH10ACI2_24350 [soil metagenome]